MMIFIMAMYFVKKRSYLDLMNMVHGPQVPDGKGHPPKGGPPLAYIAPTYVDGIRKTQNPYLWDVRLMHPVGDSSICRQSETMVLL
jgi:hypothetical protein